MVAFYAFSLLGSAFTIWMAVEAVRRGQAGSWLWIILFFGPVGATVYFFSEIAPRGGMRLPWAPAVSADELRRAESEVKRLDNAAAWLAYAAALRGRRRFTEAVAAARRARERAPGVEAAYELGLALAGAGLHQDAAQVLGEVVAADPFHDSGDALFARAQAQEAGRDLPGARQSLERLVTRYARAEVLYRLAWVQDQTGDRPTAQATLRRLIEEAEYVSPVLRRSIQPWVKKAKQALRQIGG